jgi:hypothetical protein
VDSGGLALRWRTVVDDGSGNGLITHSMLLAFGYDGSLLSISFTREVGSDSYVYEIICNINDCSSINDNTTAHTMTFTNTVFPVFSLGGSATDSITLNGTLDYSSVASQLAGGSPGPVVNPGSFGTLTLVGADTSQIGTSYTPEFSYLQNPDRPAWEIETNGRSRSFWVTINADGTAKALQYSDVDAGGDLNAPIYIYQLNCGVPGVPDCTALADHVVIDLVAKTVTITDLSVSTYGFYNETGPITLNGTLTYTGTLVFP